MRKSSVFSPRWQAWTWRRRSSLLYNHWSHPPISWWPRPSWKRYVNPGVLTEYLWFRVMRLRVPCGCSVLVLCRRGWEERNMSREAEEKGCDHNWAGVQAELLPAPNQSAHHSSCLLQLLSWRNFCYELPWSWRFSDKKTQLKVWVFWNTPL